LRTIYSHNVEGKKGGGGGGGGGGGCGGGGGGGVGGGGGGGPLYRDSEVLKKEPRKGCLTLAIKRLT